MIAQDSVDVYRIFVKVVDDILTNHLFDKVGVFFQLVVQPEKTDPAPSGNLLHLQRRIQAGCQNNRYPDDTGKHLARMDLWEQGIVVRLRGIGRKISAYLNR